MTDLDDDWELPPSPWERAQYGDDEAWARRRTLVARHEGELDPAMPTARRTPRPSTAKIRQVNFRTTTAGYEELTRTASIYELTPTALAAVLTRDGVARILREHRAA